MKCQNYYGVRFVKGLHILKNKSTQKAEVCYVFFSHPQSTLPNDGCDRIFLFNRFMCCSLFDILYCSTNSSLDAFLIAIIQCTPECQCWAHMCTILADLCVFQERQRSRADLLQHGQKRPCNRYAHEVGRLDHVSVS